MRIGQRQLRILIMIASPTRVLITIDRVSAALVKRGLIRELVPGGACCITPAGLRLLADEMEAGRVDDALEAIRKDADAREAATNARRAA